MKLWKESVMFTTDNRILILTYGSSNCLQLEKNNSFSYCMEIRRIRWKAINTTAWKTYTNVQWCELIPRNLSPVCGSSYWFSSNIYKRSMFTKTLVEKFSRDTTDHSIVEVGKASSWNTPYWIKLVEAVNLFSSLGFSESQPSAKISIRSLSCSITELEEWRLNSLSIAPTGRNMLE